LVEGTSALLSEDTEEMHWGGGDGMDEEKLKEEEENKENDWSEDKDGRL
jgi:hypothetical protein